MSTLNLAAQLKQSIENTATFDAHPMQSAYNEDKLNYLKALSLMIYADQARDADEVAYFGTLVRTLNPTDTTLDGLLAFAEAPDLADVPTMQETLRKQDQIGIAFLMDLTMLATMGTGLESEEKALIGACRGFLGWDHAVYNTCFSICWSVAEGNSGDKTFEIGLTALPADCIAHVLQHRGLQRTATGVDWNDWSKEDMRNCALPDEKWRERMFEQLLVQSSSENMATRVKTALDSVMALSSHPLQDAALEDKINYLKALSLVMAADGKIVPEEQTYFGAITRTLVNDGILPEIMAYASKPDLSEVGAMIETMAKSQDYQKALVLDAVVLAHADGKIEQDEQELIEQLRQVVKWDHAQFNITCGYAKALASEPESVILVALCRDLVPSLTKHILEYRGITTSEIVDIAAALGIAFEDKPQISSDPFAKHKLVSQRPVTIQQFVPFLQYLLYKQNLQVAEGKLKIKLLIDLPNSGLSINNGIISLEEIYQSEPVTHISHKAKSMYCKWLSSFGPYSYSIHDETLLAATSFFGSSKPSNRYKFILEMTKQ